MPCRSGFEDEPTIRIVDKHLQPELDRVTNLFCITTRFLQTHHYSVFNLLLLNVKGYKEWVAEHEVLDEQRWYKHYCSIYPNFSLEEIAKMVRNGILEVP